jgi:hypothetical protein
MDLEMHIGEHYNYIDQFSDSFRHSPGGFAPRAKRNWAPRGFAPDSIPIVRRSERRTIRFSLRLCERGGKKEQENKDGDEGRSDWLGWNKEK